MGMCRGGRREVRRRGSGVRLCLPVLCVLLGAAWAQNSQPGVVNIASGRPESSYTQSSNYKINTPSSNGANGNTDGVYSSSNCIHTANQYYRESYRRYGNDRNPWWQVDLGRPYYIYHFKIWGRTGQISRLYPFTIRVDGTECVTVNRSSERRDLAVNCSRPLHGQVVRLTRQDPGHWDYMLSMCEFQILVCNPGYYGMDCSQRCHQHCSSEGCYMNDGKCITCEPGWYGDDCLKPCPSPHCKDLKCDQRTGVCLACPGHLVGDNCAECSPGSYGDTCQHSCSTQAPGCHACERDGTCTACSDNFEAPDCTVCREGYYKSSSGSCQQCGCASLGCDPETGKCNGRPDRRYGDQCTKNCSSGCVTCDQDSGQCTKCDYNRSPPDCDECLDGYYDKRSLRYCSLCTWTCLNGTFCDKTTGYCPACPPGKRGNKCQSDCERGKYGLNCSLRCGRCQDYTCDPEDGSCDRCHAGWQLPLCQEECENGTYGVGCQKSCGHCLAGAACDKARGTCQGCDPGWYPPSCQRECNDGWYGPNCKQRCGICLNNAICNKTNGHCRCPVGKQHPFCDKDCQNGTYGQDCQYKCGHCREGSVCDSVSGHCPHGCQPGWIDPAGLSIHLCSTECPAGLYGDQCNQTCGHCHSSSSCHHVTGQCLQGCVEGFTGAHCMEAARDETLLVVVVILAAVVTALVVAVIALVLRLRRGRRAVRTDERRSSRQQTGAGIEDLPNQTGSQAPQPLLAQPVREEEGLYSEADLPLSWEEDKEREHYIDVDRPPSAPYVNLGSETPHLVSEVQAAAAVSATDLEDDRDGTVQTTGGRNNQLPGKGSPARSPQKATAAPNHPAGKPDGGSLVKNPKASATTPQRRLLPDDDKGPDSGARSSSPATERKGERPALTLKQKPLAPMQEPSRQGPRPDREEGTPSPVPSFDLASIFSSRPAEQPDDGSYYEDVELQVCHPETYERCRVYQNTTDQQLYEKLQSSSK